MNDLNNVPPVELVSSLEQDMLVSKLRGCLKDLFFYNLSIVTVNEVINLSNQLKNLIENTNSNS